MADDERLSIDDLRTLEAQVFSASTDDRGTVVFLEDGMLPSSDRRSRPSLSWRSGADELELLSA